MLDVEAALGEGDVSAAPGDGEGAQRAGIVVVEGCAADFQVAALAAEDHVLAVAADHEIAAGSAHEHVVAIATDEDIVAPTADEHVVTSAAVDFGREFDLVFNVDVVVAGAGVDDDA